MKLIILIAVLMHILFLLNLSIIKRQKAVFLLVAGLEIYRQQNV